MKNNFDRFQTVKWLIIAQVIMMIICSIVFDICSDVSCEYEYVATIIINVTNGITCLPLLGLIIVTIIIGIQGDDEDSED